MFDELKDIFLNRKTDEIVPFLKKLSPKDKKELQPKLQELLSMGNFRKGEEPVFYAVAFVCCNKTQYKNLTRWAYYGGFEIYNEILDWYNPDWFSGYVNERYDGHPSIPYHLLVEWEEKGYITLQPETIANVLADKLTDLNKYPVTLQKHIWHIFEYETNLYWSNVYENREHSGSLAYLTEIGLIDRNHILKECLLTANRNFNKNLTGWFADLFNELKPTREELLSLQPELFGTLHSPQSKALNNALNHIKTIADAGTFDYNEFITYIPILITSTVKTTLKGVIDISEKLLTTRKELTPVICPALCNGFISKDEAIQKKLAKLLAKYGDKDLLKQHLAAYSENILKSVEPLLSGFYDFTPANEHNALSVEEYETPLPFLREENKIQHITSFDDYIFFLNQAFDNNQIYDVLFVPVYIQRFHNQITSDNLYMLEPVVKRTVQISESWSDKAGLIHKLYASFFIHYMDYLVEKYPEISGTIKQLTAKLNNRFVNWRSKFMYPETYPYYFLLLKIFDSIKKEEPFDLLSTPTHEPVWLDPLTLVYRLEAYQKQGKEPFSYDLQYALQQCALDYTGKALETAKKVLTGELKELMVFLLDKQALASKNVKHPAWWMTASIIKHPHTIPSYIKEWGFSDIPEVYLTGDFSRKIANDSFGNPALQLFLPPYHVKNTEKSTVAQFSYGKFRNRSIISGDVSLLICTSPWHHDTINAHILALLSFTAVPTYYSNAFTAILTLNLPLSKMDCLLLASGMLSADKTSRYFAAEVWTATVRRQHVNSTQVGKDMGGILNSKISPAKRLTELIENNLLTGSPLINKSLKKLLSGVLSEIKAPITNLKKLLEIYSELLALTNSKADMEKTPQLTDWAEENSLKKIVKQIIDK